MSSHKERGKRDEEESFFSLRSKENVHISCKWNQRRKKNKIKSFSAKNFLSHPSKKFQIHTRQTFSFLVSHSRFESLDIEMYRIFCHAKNFPLSLHSSVEMESFNAKWEWTKITEMQQKHWRNFDIELDKRPSRERERKMCNSIESASPQHQISEKKRKTLSFEFSSAEKFRCSRRREREGLVYEVPYFVAQMKYSTRRNFPRPPAGGRSRTTMKARRRRPEREREKKNSNRICWKLFFSRL